MEGRRRRTRHGLRDRRHALRVLRSRRRPAPDRDLLPGRRRVLEQPQLRAGRSEDVRERRRRRRSPVGEQGGRRRHPRRRQSRQSAARIHDRVRTVLHGRRPPRRAHRALRDQRRQAPRRRLSRPRQCAAGHGLGNAAVHRSEAGLRERRQRGRDSVADLRVAARASLHEGAGRAAGRRRRRLSHRIAWRRSSSCGARRAR